MSLESPPHPFAGTEDCECALPALVLSFSLTRRRRNFEFFFFQHSTSSFSRECYPSLCQPKFHQSVAVGYFGTGSMIMRVDQVVCLWKKFFWQWVNETSLWVSHTLNQWTCTKKKSCWLEHKFESPGMMRSVVSRFTGQALNHNWFFLKQVMC